MGNGKYDGWSRDDIEWAIALAGRHPDGIDTSDVWDDWEDEDEGDFAPWNTELLAELEGLAAPYGTIYEEITALETLKQTAIDAANATPVSAAVMDAAEDAVQAVHDRISDLEEVAADRVAEAERLDLAWEALADRFADIRAEKKALLDEARILVETVSGFVAPDAADPEEIIALERVREREMPTPGALPTLPDAPEKIPATPEDLEAARDRVAAFERQLESLEALDPAENAARRGSAVVQQEVGRIEAQVAERVRTHAALLVRADNVTETGTLPAQQKELAQDRAVVTGLRNEPASIGVVENLKAAVAQLEDDAARIAAEIADFGGAERVASLAAAAKVSLDDFPAFEADLGGAKAAADLARGFSDNEIGTLCETLPGGAKDLAALAAAFGGGAALAAAANELGGVDRLAKLLAGGTLDASGAKALVDGLGAAFVGAAVNASGNPATAVAIQAELAKSGTNLKTLATATGTDAKPAALLALFDPGCGGDAAKFAAMADGLAKDAPAASMLKDLVTDGGMGDNPQALASLYSAGCEGDPAKLTALLGHMDAGDPEHMKSLLENGGLNDAPEAFGHLVGIGCEGDGAKLSTLLSAMDSDAARAGLKGLLTDGGLKGSKDVKPECLAALLDPGCGGDATEFAALCTDVKPKDLGKLLKSGGLGREPAILGPLIQKGCKGKAADVNALTAKLGESDERLTKTKNLLGRGGFGARKPPPDTGPTGTEPECLAVLFATGCEGKPDELANLLDALDLPATINLSKMMVEGDLGKHPEVLGNLYKHGCLDNPDGASDGAKRPDTLKDLATAFSTGSGPARFKSLMVDGGFGTAGKEKRLGSVVRHAFTPKTGAPPRPDVQQVRELANAFNSDMVGLDSMLSALETAPDHILDTDDDSAAQPGGGLRNVVFAAGSGSGHDGKAGKLKTRFYDPLKARAASVAGSPGMLSENELIQNAASLELKPPTVGDTETVTSPGGVDTISRSDHFMKRHTRGFNNIEVKGRNTLWPRDVDEAAVTEKVGVAVDALVADATLPVRGQRDPAHRPPDDKRDPPEDEWDLEDPPDQYTLYDNVAGDGNDVFRVSYDLVGGDVKITQFFPQGGDDLVTILRHDFEAIRKAIHAETP